MNEVERVLAILERKDPKEMLQLHRDARVLRTFTEGAHDETEIMLLQWKCWPLVKFVLDRGMTDVAFMVTGAAITSARKLCAIIDPVSAATLAFDLTDDAGRLYLVKMVGGDPYLHIRRHVRNMCPEDQDAFQRKLYAAEIHWRL